MKDKELWEMMTKVFADFDAILDDMGKRAEKQAQTLKAIKDAMGIKEVKDE